MGHSCQNSCPSLRYPLLTTAQLSLPGVLVCCQGGSPRNAELLQQAKVCLGVRGLWGEAVQGLREAEGHCQHDALYPHPQTEQPQLYSSLLTVPGKTAPPEPLPKAPLPQKAFKQILPWVSQENEPASGPAVCPACPEPPQRIGGALHPFSSSTALPALPPTRSHDNQNQPPHWLSRLRASFIPFGERSPSSPTLSQGWGCPVQSPRALTESPQLIPSLAARPCFPRLRILSTGTLAGKRARNTSEMLLPGKPSFLQIKG